MVDDVTRREFLRQTARAGTALAFAPSIMAAASPSDRVVVGVMGTGGRGSSLARSFARLDGAEVAYVCDVDAVRRREAREGVAEVQERAPQAVNDFRRILDDRAVDALVVAAPDHWHAPASIMAMQASKHVYVEKPCSHNPREGELLVQAKERYGRVVQMGNQRRSWPNIVEGIAFVKSGAIGRPYFARGWYANRRGPTHLEQAEVPAHLDWDLWQGPAPRVAYAENIHPYDWHWFWNWGTGEAGNNGVHSLDLCRWGLDVDYPVRVTSGGGRYHYDDDWETPDTQIVTLEFEGDKTISWEGRSANARPIEGSGFGASFHGEDGTVVITGGNAYTVFDNDNNVVRRASSPEEFNIDAGHLANFVAAIRAGEPLRSPIEDGRKSTLLCHLGNIAQRTGREIDVDPLSGRVRAGTPAQRLWGRSYAPGWKPTI